LAGILTATWCTGTSPRTRALGPHHCVASDASAGSEHRLGPETDIVFDDRAVDEDVRLLDDVVTVAVDGHVVGDGDTVPDSEFSTVVEQDVLVDDRPVPHLDVVTVREPDAAEQLEVVTGLGEQVVRHHLSERQCHTDVVGQR